MNALKAKSKVSLDVDSKITEDTAEFLELLNNWFDLAIRRIIELHSQPHMDCIWKNKMHFYVKFMKQFQM